jgi:hypothetical protein
VLCTTLDVFLFAESLVPECLSSSATLGK